MTKPLDTILTYIYVYMYVKVYIKHLCISSATYPRITGGSSCCFHYCDCSLEAEVVFYTLSSFHRRKILQFSYILTLFFLLLHLIIVIASKINVKFKKRLQTGISRFSTPKNQMHSSLR